MVGTDVTNLKTVAIFPKIAALRRMMSKELPKKNRKVTTAEVIRNLQEKDSQITEEEAEKVLDLLYFLAKLTVDQNFKK